MGKALNISDVSFDNEVKRSTVPVLVDFWAPWCGPCKMQVPVIDELSEELNSKVKFVKLNVDENRQKAGEYNVSGIPTLILFKDGKIVQQMTGFHNKSQLKSIVERYM